jgi:hypothetical protein
MKVSVFDLVAYGGQLDQLKVANERPCRLPKRFVNPDVVALGNLP